MKRFTQFLKEEAGVSYSAIDRLKKDDAIKLIQENCSDILNLYKYSNFHNVLYRGVYRGAVGYSTDDALTNDAQINQFLGRYPTQRKTLDSSKRFQGIVDASLKNFGAKALRSNSIFVTPLDGVAQSYGELFIVFPYNGVSFTVSGNQYHSDLYNSSSRILSSNDLYKIPLSVVYNIKSVSFNSMGRLLSRLIEGRSTDLMIGNLKPSEFYLYTGISNIYVDVLDSIADVVNNIMINSELSQKYSMFDRVYRNEPILVISHAALHLKPSDRKFILSTTATDDTWKEYDTWKEFFAYVDLFKFASNMNKFLNKPNSTPEQYAKYFNLKEITRDFIPMTEANTPLKSLITQPNEIYLHSPTDDPYIALAVSEWSPQDLRSAFAQTA